MSSASELAIRRYSRTTAVSRPERSATRYADGSRSQVSYVLITVTVVVRAFDAATFTTQLGRSKAIRKSYGLRRATTTTTRSTATRATTIQKRVMSGLA